MLASALAIMPTVFVAVGFWTWLAMVLFLIACFLLILTVLIQKPQGGGLAGAFGSGAGSGQTAFGARTGDALTVATIGMFLFYLLTAIGLNRAMAPASEVPEAPATATTPAAPAAPGTPAKPAEGNVGVTPTNKPTETTPPAPTKPNDSAPVAPGTKPASEVPATKPAEPAAVPSAPPATPPAPTNP